MDEQMLEDMSEALQILEGVMEDAEDWPVSGVVDNLEAAIEAINEAISQFQAEEDD